jgi:TonB family protein
MRLPGLVSLLLHAAFLALFTIGARFEPSLGGGLGPGDFTPVSLIDASQLPGPPPRRTAPPAPEPEEEEVKETPKEPEPVPVVPEPEAPKPEPPKPEPEKEDPGVNIADEAPKVAAKTPPDTTAAEPAPKPARPRGSQAAAEEALAGVQETKAGRDGGLVAAGIESGMDGGEGGGGGGGGGGGFGDFGYYRLAIQNRIGSNWSPAFVSGEAVTIVYFRIIRSGAIVGARVEESSGISFYDQTALRAVLSSSPLPPLPAQFPEDAVGVHFRFRYKQ